MLPIAISNIPFYVLFFEEFSWKQYFKWDVEYLGPATVGSHSCYKDEGQGDYIFFYLSQVRAGTGKVGQPSWSYGHEGHTTARCCPVAGKESFQSPCPPTFPSSAGASIDWTQKSSRKPERCSPQESPSGSQRKTEKEEARLREESTVEINQQSSRDFPKTVSLILRQHAVCMSSESL